MVPDTDETPDLQDAAEGRSPADKAGADEANMDPIERIAALEEEVETLRDKAARAQADYQNLRRRSSTEHDAGIKRALQPLLDELLLVLDFLELALASPCTTDEAKNLAMGVEMTRTKLLQSLESVEVHPIVAEGTFDPALHDATETRATDAAGPGTILETKRRGYTWREQVLRPAQVIVAADPQAEDAPNEDA